MKKPLIKFLRIVILVFAITFFAIQFLPFGRDHQNPTIVQEPTWDDPATRALAVRACYDCHSNETVWPWYSNIAPVSWLVQRDVDEGRSKLNFSNINNPENEYEELGEVVREGEMPPLQYFPTHPDARLTNAERETLARGFEATFSQYLSSKD